MKPLVVFSHGKDAAPWGRKISFLAPAAEQAGWRVMSVDYTDLENPDARVERLRNRTLGAYSRLVLVGSSMGGYVSVLAAEFLQPDGMFLMAPALFLPGYAMPEPSAHGVKTLVCSGWNDAVVPVDSSIRFARENRAELHLFNSDHLLWDVLPAIRSLFAAFLNQVAETPPLFR